MQSWKGRLGEAEGENGVCRAWCDRRRRSWADVEGGERGGDQAPEPWAPGPQPSPSTYTVPAVPMSPR